MDDKVFEACMKFYTDTEARNFWGVLAKEYSYSSKDAIRSAFKRERKKRGIPSKKDGDYLISNKIKNIREERPDKSPNILIVDIETSPLVCFSWGIYDQKILPENIVSDWFVISFAAKWLFDKEAISYVLSSEEATKQDDKRVVNKIWELIDQADIVVTYNGDRFDLRKLNARFATYQLPPPSFYKSVDLYKVAKDNFSFTSNRLSFVNTILGIDNKIETNFELWKACYFGDAKALLEMEKYNINDVYITEMLYLKILPWIHNHPNINVYTEENIQLCPKCGSENLVWDKKYYYTQVSKFDTFRCEDCKSTGRARKNLLDKEKRNSIII